MDPTRDSIATIVADCLDDDMQLDLLDDLWLDMWPLGDCLLHIDWTHEDVRYIGEPWTYSEVVQFGREHNVVPRAN